jgi:hypothetical protein
MAPMRNNDPITDAEHRLILIALRLDAALHYRAEFPSKVNEEEYLSCINIEMVCALFY